jgi:hypothetical protein
MTPQEALAELLARVGASGGSPVFISVDELACRPPDAVFSFKNHKILTPAGPARSVVCPRCERQCIMPINVVTGMELEAWVCVVCDKRSDINVVRGSR